MATQWSLDFCLVCDQQISGGAAYCSQGCRLADLDQHNSSDSTSHSHYSSSSKSTMRPKANNSTLKGRPPIHSSSSSSSSSSHEHSSSLTSTSSQTSLSSLGSTSATLSHQVRHELQDYTKCFDPVRDWKRRLTNS